MGKIRRGNYIFITWIGDHAPRRRRPAVKIRSVKANNRRKAFEIETNGIGEVGGALIFPYANLRVPPGADNRITRVFADPELGEEAFTYLLESGEEDSIHLDAVLDYNEDPGYLGEILLHKLTVEARKRVAESTLSRREIIRRLGTSASQFYRLLDPTHHAKSVGQMVALFHILECDVELVVTPRGEKAGGVYAEASRE